MFDANIRKSQRNTSNIHNHTNTLFPHSLRHYDVTRSHGSRQRCLADLNISCNATDLDSRSPQKVGHLQGGDSDDTTFNKLDPHPEIHQVDMPSTHHQHSDLLQSLRSLDISSNSPSSMSLGKDKYELPSVGSYSSFCDPTRLKFDSSSVIGEINKYDDLRHKVNISRSYHNDKPRHRDFDNIDQSVASKDSGGKKSKRKFKKRKSRSYICISEATDTSNDSNSMDLNSNKTKPYNKGQGLFTILSSSKKKMTSKELKEVREFWRVLVDNIWLNDANRNLRLRLQHVRTTTFAESSRILDSIMTYCDAKAKATKIRKHVPGENRVKHGCPEFSKICGGYTPGGWNKLRSMGLIKDDEILPTDCRGCEGAIDSASVGGEQEGADDIRPQNKRASLQVPRGPGVPGSNTKGPEKRVAVNMEGGSGFRPSARLLGEMAFQLERRILDYVFGLGDGQKKRRFYGYTVSNICYMMEKESTNHDGGSDVIGRTEMTCRLRKLLCALDKYGYDIKIHADFSQEIINKYGLLPNTPDQSTVDTFGLNDPATITCLISRLSKRQSEVHNLNILLNCLHFMSTCDGRTLFVW